MRSYPEKAFQSKSTLFARAHHSAPGKVETGTATATTGEHGTESTGSAPDAFQQRCIVDWHRCRQPLYVRTQPDLLRQPVLQQTL